MSAFDLLVDCVKDATKERDELADALEQAQTRYTSLYNASVRRIEERDKRIEQLEAALREATDDPGGEYYTGLHCGIEDRDIHDRYEAADYGWEKAFEYAQSVVNPLFAGESDPAVAVGPNATGANALIVPDMNT